MRGIRRGERVSLYVNGYLCLVSGQRTVGAFVVLHSGIVNVSFIVVSSSFI